MKYLLVILISLFFENGFSQKCIHKNLSKKYDFKTSITRYQIPKQFDSCAVVMNIYRKNNSKPVQQIKYNSTWMIGDTFANCNAVRSYITKINTNAEVVDNEFGDLIICDLNFDGLEDFAIKVNSGGNGGPNIITTFRITMDSLKKAISCLKL